jgi:hypothetical protein
MNEITIEGIEIKPVIEVDEIELEEKNFQQLRADHRRLASCALSCSNHRT